MDTPTPAKLPAPGMCRGLAPTSVKEAEASIRLTISAGNGVAAQRDAEHLLSTVVAGDRALVLNALAHLHAANGDVLALGCLPPKRAVVRSFMVTRTATRKQFCMPDMRCR